MMFKKGSWSGWAILMSFLGGAVPIGAAADDGLPPSAQLKEMIVQVESQDGLGEDAKASAREALRAAAGFAEQAAADAEAMQVFSRQAAEMESMLAALREEQRQTLDPGALEQPPLDVAELESWILRQQVDLDLAVNRRKAAAKELERLRTRPDAIRGDIEPVNRALSALPAEEVPGWTDPGPDAAAAIRRG